jgi:hypothetical protein
MDARQLMKPMRFAVLCAPALVLALSACENAAPEAPTAQETEVPEELQGQAIAPDQPAGEAGIGTPMAERVATIGLLNKRNNLSQDLEMSPGESRRFGNVIVRLSACERTAPWEMPKETGAFVQVLTRENNDEEWATTFSGWLFKESPSLNVVEHPIYDVWVKDCAMSFPGDARPAAPAAPAARAPEPSAAEPETSET